MLSCKWSGALVIWLATCVVGCSSVTKLATSGGQPTQPSAFLITPAPPNIVTAGQTIGFTATTGLTQIPNVVWTLDPLGASFGQLSSNGVYTAPAFISPTALGQNITVRGTDTGTNVQMSVNFRLGNSAPSLSSSSPSQVKSGSVTQLTVTGSGLSLISNISVNGVTVPATVLSDTQITLVYTTALWDEGNLAITAATPAPGGGTSAPLIVPIISPQVSYDSASRFLSQAAWGPTDSSIQQVQNSGFSAYLDQQMAAAPDYFWTDDDTGHEAADLFLWAQYHDYSQLRTKMAWIWWKLFNTPLTSVGWVNTTVPDTCNRDAFGSFETLLKDITFNPIMGRTLSYDQLDYPGHNPNQNFGRESMQLFSIGPVLLNQDGSPKLDLNGVEIPAYTQLDVEGISRALTGFVHPPEWNLGNDPHGLVPLQSSIDFPHDEDTKAVLGASIPANQTVTQDMTAVVHILASHPNVGPFMSSYLIHELVTSNPSREYVARISGIWEDDGNGNRGNILAVVKAILLDPEARAGDTGSGLTDIEGRFRDPVGYETFVFRATKNTGGQFSSLGMNTVFGNESIWASPSIFSFYQQFNTLPNSTVLAPEYQLYTPQTIQSRAWFLYDMIYLPAGVDPIISNYDWNYWGNLSAGDGIQFIDYINHLAFHGTMSADLRNILIADAQNNSNLTVRAQQMMLDVFLSPEAGIQR